MESVKKSLGTHPHRHLRNEYIYYFSIFKKRSSQAMLTFVHWISASAKTGRNVDLCCHFFFTQSEIKRRRNLFPTFIGFQMGRVFEEMRRGGGKCGRGEGLLSAKRPPLTTFLTEHFTILEPDDPAIKGFYVDQKRWSLDFEALKLWNVRSASRSMA